MRERSSTGELFDIPLACAVVVVVLGVVYAATGGAREKARQEMCVAHLRGIGRAVAMYREDYGGGDSPAGPYAMGFPPSPFVLIDATRPRGGRYIGAGPGVFRCPDDPGRAEAGVRRCDYTYDIWFPGDKLGHTPSFEVAVSRRGANFPLMIDTWHDAAVSRPDRAHATRFVLVLRLDGRVSASRVPVGSDGWLW